MRALYCSRFKQTIRNLNTQWIFYDVKNCFLIKLRYLFSFKKILIMRYILKYFWMKWYDVWGLYQINMWRQMNDMMSEICQINYTRICLLSVHFSVHTSYFNKWVRYKWNMIGHENDWNWKISIWECIILFSPPLDECKIIKNKIPMRTNDTSSQKCWIRIQFFQKTGNNSTNYKLYKPDYKCIW